MNELENENSRYYSSLYRELGNRRPLEVVLRSSLIKKVIERNHVNFASVLDVGCGTCTLLDMLRCLRKTGVDIVKSNSSYEVIKHSLDSDPTLPFPDRSFDIVVLSHILEHLREWKKIIIESVRVLGRKGSLIIALPKESSHRCHTRGFSVERIERTIKERGWNYSIHCNYYLPKLPERFGKGGIQAAFLREINNIIVKYPLSIEFLDRISRVMGFPSREVIIEVNLK